MRHNVSLTAPKTTCNSDNMLHCHIKKTFMLSVQYRKKNCTLLNVILAVVHMLSRRSDDYMSRMWRWSRHCRVHSGQWPNNPIRL